MRKPALTLIAAALLISSGVVAVVPAASGANILAFIKDVNTSWGTPSSPTGASPGDRDLSLTVTFQYTYPAEASSVQALLTLPSGFSLYDGTNQTFTSTQGGVSTDSIFQLTFGGIFLSPSLSLGTYNFSLNMWAYLPASGGFTVLPESLTVSVYVEGTPQLQFSASSPSLAPGQVDDVPLTVSNVGTGNASQISLTVSANGVSVLTPSLTVQSLGAGQSADVGVDVFVPASASGSAVSLAVAATYYDPYGAQQSVSRTVGFYTATSSPSQLSFQAADATLVPGVANTVPITLTNQGGTAATQIRTTVTSSSQVSILTQFPYVAELAAGSSTNASIEVYVSGSLASSPLSLTLSFTYTDEQGVTDSYTQALGLYALASNSSIPSVLVSVSPLKSGAKVGTQSEVTFDVEDVGPATLESPVLSLAVSSPLVVIQNSSYAVPGGALRPGESMVYEALVGSSTSASPGFYPASVTVTYMDQSGAVKSATFSSGLVLSGAIDLIFQSPQVTQGNTTLSVSGEILNEGFSAGYYASVTGAVTGASGTSAADYVGEIDPNTPVPFSLTIDYAPQAVSRAANISVTVTFRDSLGTESTYNSSFETTLRPVSSLAGATSSSASTSSRFDLLTYLEVGVIVALVAITAAGIVYVRRSRRATPAEPVEKEDQGVI